MKERRIHFEEMIRTAERGNTRAQRRLGKCYLYGDGIERNYEEAIRWFRSAALSDDYESLYLLSRCYRQRCPQRENPDNALEKTNTKFIKRFTYIEEHSIRVGKPLTEMTLEEMDALWNEAKKSI